MSNTEFTQKYEGWNITQLATQMKAVQEELNKAKESQTAIQKEFDFLRLIAIPEEMDNMGVSSMKIKGIGRLGVTGDMYTGIVADHKEEAYQWLIDNGHGDLIKETVNSSTLKAFLKEQIKKGETIPEELFKVSPFERASITKA